MSATRSRRAVPATLPATLSAALPARLGATLAALALVATGCRSAAEPERTVVDAPREPTAVATPSPGETGAAPPSPASSPEPAMPAVADDPEGLAAQLTRTERDIRDPDATDAVVREAAHLQQVAYRALARRPEWRDRVLAAVPEDLRGAVRANADAVADLVAMVTPLPAGNRPDWRIVPPAPAGELLGHYREAEAAFGIGWEYLAAIHLVETRMGRIGGTSVAGAQGPMQFMPGTWASYGEGDVHDDRDAIMAAGRYLRAMGGPGDMDRALRRYNNSARYVRAIQGHAAVLRVEPVVYRAYHGWQVHYLTEEGDLLLPEGYPDRTAVVADPA